MFELKNQIQICLTVAERSKCVKEFEDIFCKLDTTQFNSYSLETVSKQWPTIAELFKLMEKL